jgi:mannosyl-oligosaccharide alpha-1,2-mannosidase
VSSRRDYIYLTKAVDLADRLLSAYESRPGIPYASVNLHTRQGIPSHADSSASSIAEFTTLQLEMKYINYVTATEYLEIGQSEQRNQKGRLIELKDLID